MNSCNDDELVPGNPVMDFKTETGDACFGDSLPFIINASDMDVPLSTLKAQLFYGEEKVSETVIRTKTSGEDYTGKIFIPYYANIPDGKATLKFILQNINFTITEKEQELALVRPDFPSLILVTADKEYTMERVAKNQYSVTEEFPASVEAYIKAPAFGTNGNEITFGWTNNAIKEGNVGNIPFLNAIKGRYNISFNTLTYEASPFFNFLFGGEAMTKVDEESYEIFGEYEKDKEISVTGINIDEWDLGDAFAKKSDETVTFLLSSGKYRVVANFATKKFTYEAVTLLTIDFSSTNEFVSSIIQSQEIEFKGIDDLEDWWIDPDYFTAGENGKYIFTPLTARCKIIANKTLKYFKVEYVNADNSTTSLQSDGSGAIWIIGENIGQPSVEKNQVGWDTGKAICMARVEKGKYQITLVAGGTVSSNKINFKFFHQKGWGGEFGSDVITSRSDVVLVNEGDGNLKLAEGKTLSKGKTYVFTVDVTAGIKAAVLTVEEK